MKVKSPRVETVYGEGSRISFLLSPDSVNEARITVDRYKEKSLELTVKEDRPKRSLTANAYFSALCHKIAAVIGSDFESVKRHQVLSYGVVAERDNVPVTITLPKGIPADDYYPYCNWTYGDAESDTYECMKATHLMDSKEFSVLLDGTISDCKELGIETLSEAEIRRLYAQVDCTMPNKARR